MHPRTYALSFIGAAAGLFLALVAANVIIDPQVVFGTHVFPRTSNYNGRFVQFGYYRAAPDSYQGLLFGSSRARNFPMDQLSARMNVRLANFAVEAGMLTDHLPVLEYAVSRRAASHRRLETVVLFLDIDFFGGPPATNKFHFTTLPPALTGENELRFWWRHLTALQFRTWRQTIREARAAPPPTETADDLPWLRFAPIGPTEGPSVDPGATNAQPPKASAAPVEPSRDARITQRADFAGQLELLQRFVALCRDKGIVLIVAITPLHAGNEARYDAADLSNAIDRITRIVPVWDFTSSGALTDRPGFWYDLSHFTGEVGKLMFTRMVGDKMPSGWENFGRWRGPAAARPLAAGRTVY